jgi:hypothetical protein
MTSGPSLPARHSVARRTLSWLARHCDLLAVPLIMLASFPVAWLSPRTLAFRGTETNLIDESWVLDTSFKASRGLWFGRDVAFTYGPLFQWLSSAPSRSMGLSMGAVYATAGTLLLWWTFLCAYLTFLLLLPEQPAWKRFLLLLLLPVFWAPWEGRTAFAVFLFAVFVRGWYALRGRALKPALLGFGAASLCSVAFLYSVDTGVYATAALLLSLFGVAWESRREPQALRSYASAVPALAVSSLALVIAINAIMAKPLDFRFWKTSMAILAGYRWMEATTMSKAGKIHLLVCFVAVGIVFLARRIIARERSPSITARSGFLLSAFAFAFLTAQSGLVRSDWGHIVVAVYAMVFFTGVVLLSFPSRIASALAVLFGVAASSLFGEPPNLPSIIRHNYSQITNPLTECPNGFLEFGRVCYPQEFTRILQTTSSYMHQRSSPDDFMTVFPYQNIFGVASHRSVAGGVLQSYLASGTYLSRVDIAGLERAAAPSGFYLPDGEYSNPVDGVPNFTRSPEVWLWMFRHYRTAEELFPGIFGLQRDDSRVTRIGMQLRPVNIAPASYPILTRSSVIDLGDPAWPAGGADFLRLRLIVRYSRWWRLRKPALLLLEIERADSSHDRKPFIVEPNVSSEVWFYPWDDAELSQYFDPKENQWCLGLRPPITGLRVLVRPLDWVSVQPDAIEVQSADAVQFSMNP